MPITVLPAAVVAADRRASFERSARQSRLRRFVNRCCLRAVN